jgi:hypothetical protein
MHVAREITVTARGRVWRPVTCQYCRLQWAYLLMRKREGTGESMWMLDDAGAAARAEEEAKRLLEQSLEKDIEPIPCPGCHRLQDEMHGAAALDAYGKWYGLAILDVVAGAIFCGVWGNASFLKNCVSWPGSLFFLAAVAMAIYGAVRSLLYDPNREDRVRERAEKNEEPKLPVIRRAEYEELTRKGPSRFFGDIRWAA